MGLTSGSTGRKAVDRGLDFRREEGKYILALAGNPNVGKSTLFNELTGMNQHTGNWPGKTVSSAQGSYCYKEERYHVVDLPGTYSLFAHSAEEEVAREFICFGNPDVVVVVCDATCLERNLNLVLQTMEITDNVVVCLNLMDEAEKKKIEIDVAGLSNELSVPVVACSARSRRGIEKLQRTIREQLSTRIKKPPVKVRYEAPIEHALTEIEKRLLQIETRISRRWIALKLLEGDAGLVEELSRFLNYDLTADQALKARVKEMQHALEAEGLAGERLHDKIVGRIVTTAEQICAETVRFDPDTYCRRDRRIDRILTSRWTGIPIMLLLLAAIFYITIWGANYPSEFLSGLFTSFEAPMIAFFEWLHAPQFLTELLVYGVYRVLTWVVAVMLPPMAIFFPLFTLLEDVGYLPRVAFNLDKYFKKCNACGKQALTTWKTSKVDAAE